MKKVFILLVFLFTCLLSAQSTHAMFRVAKGLTHLPKYMNVTGGRIPFMMPRASIQPSITSHNEKLFTVNKANCLAVAISIAATLSIFYAITKNFSKCQRNLNLDFEDPSILMAYNQKEKVAVKCKINKPDHKTGNQYNSDKSLNNSQFAVDSADSMDNSFIASSY